MAYAKEVIDTFKVPSVTGGHIKKSSLTKTHDHRS